MVDFNYLSFITDKKIEKLDTDDLDEIEKIANWAAIFVLLIGLCSRYILIQRLESELCQRGCLHVQQFYLRWCF